MTNPADSLCKFLAWDTDFFGYRIARLTGNRLTKEQAVHIDAWCIDNKIDCLYFLAESNHADTIFVAEDNGYRQMDIRVTYEIDLRKAIPEAKLADGLVKDVATAADIESMIPMIDHAFENSRFYYDPHFSSEQANNLYKIWLRRSIEEDFADYVLLIKKEGIAQGFITCSLNEDTKIGEIDLVGVAEFARGQNLGQSLILSSLNYFKRHNMERVEVVTQGRNIPANRLYQKCGFRTSSVYLWFHKWFTQPG